MNIQHPGINLFLAFPLAYIGGLLVSFTPCIYPLIPVTLSFIGSRQATTKTKAFMISLVYVIGIAVTYAVLGAIASFTGRVFGTLTQKPGVFLVVGNVFILLGLNMLGVFRLNLAFIGNLQNILPSGMRTGYAAIFVVGLVSGLVVGPCTAPALGALLAYVAFKHNVVFGTLLLFFFAMGMGTLLILLGTFANIIKIKSGPWTEKIEKIFGWFLILTGEYFLIRAGQLWI
jgi:thiol:disulfide interchange protein DsbD